MDCYLIILIGALIFLSDSVRGQSERCTKIGEVNKINGLFYGYRGKYVAGDTFLESLYIYNGEQLLRLKTYHPYGETSLIVHLRAYTDDTPNRDLQVFDQNYDKFYADEGVITANKNFSFTRQKISQTRYGLKKSYELDAFPTYHVTYEIEDPDHTPAELRLVYFAPVAYLFLRQDRELMLTRFRFSPLEPISQALADGALNLAKAGARIKKFPIEFADLPLPDRKPDFFIPYSYRLFHGAHSFGLFRDGRHKIFKNFPEGERLRMLEEGEVIPKIELFKCVKLYEPQ